MEVPLSRARTRAVWASPASRSHLEALRRAFPASMSWESLAFSAGVPRVSTPEPAAWGRSRHLEPRRMIAHPTATATPISGPLRPSPGGPAQTARRGSQRVVPRLEKANGHPARVSRPRRRLLGSRRLAQLAQPDLARRTREAAARPQ